MMDLIDGATAALDAFHAQQDRAEREYETFGARVVEDLISDLMEGRAVTTVRGIKVNLAFILDGQGFISDDEAAALIVMNADDRAYFCMDLEVRAKERVKDWTEYSDIAAAVIAERVRDRVLEASEV